MCGAVNTLQEFNGPEFKQTMYSLLTRRFIKTADSSKCLNLT